MKEDECRLLCAWKGGGPCALAECPRRKGAPPSLDELTQRIREIAANPDNIIMEEPDPDLVPPLEFCERFARQILKREWDSFWASEQADIDDIRDADRVAILADIARVYGVDCSDMKYLNLWRVMQRCREGGTC